jgi:hypothetical protein
MIRLRFSPLDASLARWTVAAVMGLMVLFLMVTT